MKFLNKYEVADALGVHYNTINNLIKSTNIPVLPLNGYEVFYNGQWVKLEDRFKNMRNIKYVFEKKQVLKWFKNRKK